MKLIARAAGVYGGVTYKAHPDLTPGEEYDVISIHYQDTPGHWVDKEFTHNPKGTKFYIKVVNKVNLESTFWNDYFLSTEETRDITLEELGIWY
jgi:hypothetical protein